MNSTNSSAAPKRFFEPSHVEYWLKLFSDITVAPTTAIGCYLIPLIGAMFHRCKPHMPYAESQQLYSFDQEKTDWFKTILPSAQIFRDVELYFSDGYEYTSFGGTLSLLNPIICVPSSHIQKFEESNDPKKRIWKISLLEFKFLVAREIAGLKPKYSLLRLVLKTAYISLGYFIIKIKIPWHIRIGLFIFLISLYIYTIKYFELQLDIDSIKILDHAPSAAKSIAIACLTKLAEQNQCLRKTNPLCFYVSENGDNSFLDFRPSISRRIQNIEKYEI